MQINDGNSAGIYRTDPRSPGAKPFASSRSAPTISPSTITSLTFNTDLVAALELLLHARRRRIHGSIRPAAHRIPAAHISARDFPKRNDEKFLAHSWYSAPPTDAPR